MNAIYIFIVFFLSQNNILVSMYKIILSTCSQHLSFNSGFWLNHCTYSRICNFIFILTSGPTQPDFATCPWPPIDGTTTTKPLTISATCDNAVSVYADGALVSGTHLNPWNKTSLSEPRTTVPRGANLKFLTRRSVSHFREKEMITKMMAKRMTKNYNKKMLIEKIKVEKMTTGKKLCRKK